MRKRLLHSSLALTSALTLISLSASCGSVAQLAAEQAATAATATPTASGTDSSSTVAPGTLTLTQPTTTDTTVTQVRVSLLEEQCGAGPQRQPMNQSGGRHFDHSSPWSSPGWQQNIQQGMGQQAQSTEQQCFVNDDVVAYSSGATITLNNVPVGKYRVLMVLSDANGKALDDGSTEVTITSGQTTSATVTVSAVTAVTAGSVTIDANFSSPKALQLWALPLLKTSDCVPVEIVLIDAFRRPAPALAAVSVQLTSSNSGVFYSDNACATAITTAAIPATSWYTGIYYKDATAGSATVTASDAASVLTAATMNVSVQ
jgi:hypothetical protein